MMQFIYYISDFMVPLVIFYIVGYGLLMRRNVFDQFVKGAKDGFQVVLDILPTLLGLMIGVGVLRASGFLDMLAGWLTPVTDAFHFPSELLPLATVKLFSSSAATGLLLDLYKEFGPDSLVGRTASIMMSCTETVFYTIVVYFMATALPDRPAVKKTRYTLAGALTATLAGIIASVVLAKIF